MARWGRRRWQWRFPRHWPKGVSLWTWRTPSRTRTLAWGNRVNGRGPAKKWGGSRPHSLRLPSRTKSLSRPRSAWLAFPRSDKPRPRMRRRTFWLIILLLFTLASLQAFIYMERNLRPPLMHVAKLRVKQIATQSINQAITDQVANGQGTEKLIEWKMDSDGKVSGFMLNYNEHMKITSETVKTVQETLFDLHHVPEKIPVGHALNSAIISSFGPKVPVRFEPVGAAKVELGTREKNAGINMILVEVYIHIKAEVAIIIPFDTEPELVETDIPISYLLVVGDVPMYYYDNTGKPVGESAAQAPNIAVPLVPEGSGVSKSSESLDNSGTAVEPTPAPLGH